VIFYMLVRVDNKDKVWLVAHCSFEEFMVTDFGYLYCPSAEEV